MPFFYNNQIKLGGERENKWQKEVNSGYRVRIIDSMHSGSLEVLESKRSLDPLDPTPMDNLVRSIYVRRLSALLCVYGHHFGSSSSILFFCSLLPIYNGFYLTGAIL